MSIEDIVIANPESAGRVFDPSEHIRSFLLERSWFDQFEACEPPILIWLSRPIPRPADWPTDCDCHVVYRADECSVADWRKAYGITPTGFYACPCMGRFIE